MNRLRCLLFALLCTAAGCGSGSSAGALQSGGDVDLANAANASLQADTLAQRADSLVRAGRAWRATALVAAKVASPATASPELRLAAARAAAAWDGWSEVDRVLRDAPWLDTQFGGEGRELLARSALDRGTDALPDARLALAHGTDGPSRVTRGVLLARAYDRAGQRDSASTYYLAAAARLPRVADWLRLRAAGVTGDSALRLALFARVTGHAAKARITATDAQARERAGDFVGAAQAFRRAGDDGSAFRVEGLAARDDAARAALSTRIVSYLKQSSRAATIRQALAVLDSLGQLPVADEVVVARAAATAGVTTRAIAGFKRASTVAELSAQDRMTYATSLVKAGRAAEAARMYATISGDPALAPAAAYQRARMLLQAGDGTGAREALRSVATQFASSRNAGAPALLLLADLQIDEGNTDSAAATLRELLAGYRNAAQAPLAAFRLGLIEWGASPAAAAQRFDSLVANYPNDDEVTAARYWAGRAYEKLGRKGDADQRWTTISRNAPLSYYGILASRRLGAAEWAPPTGSDTARGIAAVDSAVARIAALRTLGMDVETRFEIDALAESGEKTPTLAAAVCAALATVGEPARALRIALAAIERGTSSAALYRAAYPVVHEDALIEEARRNQLDPALVAGLIRQESSWNPRALSPANARGLMQLLPAVGASIASARRYPLWNTALLFEPDVSLELGTSHLASSLRRGTPVERALAAYNAGASRVTRWVARPGSDDDELFTEWIPFTETRDYVRLVTRNAAIYRALYGLK
ncbi:MAG: lytic transglycosylase domain-containing protein [Gemmatimonadota bacterium]